MKKHYIAQSGLTGGYMPNVSEVCDTRTQAAEFLGEIFELSGYKIKQLRKDWYMEVGEKDIYGSYNEYCEIIECNCDTPEIHSDSE